MHVPHNEALKQHLQNLLSVRSANRSDLLALIEDSKQSIGLDRLLPDTDSTKLQALHLIIRAIKTINENDSHYSKETLPDNHPHQHVIFAPFSAAANSRRSTEEKAHDQTLHRLRRCLYDLLQKDKKVKDLAPFFLHHPIFQRYTHTGWRANDTREMTAIIALCQNTQASTPSQTTFIKGDKSPAILATKRLQQIETELEIIDKHPGYASVLQKGITEIQQALQREMSLLEISSPQTHASFETAHSISQLHRDNAPYAPTPRTSEARDAKFDLESHYNQHVTEKTDALKQQLQQEKTDRDLKRAQLITEKATLEDELAITGAVPSSYGLS